MKKSQGRKETEQIEDLRSRQGPVRTKARRHKASTAQGLCISLVGIQLPVGFCFSFVCLFAVLLCFCPPAQELNASGNMSSLVAKDGSDSNGRFTRWRFLWERSYQSGYVEYYKEGEIRSHQEQLVLISIFALGLGRTIILCFMLLFYNLAI